MIKLDKKAAEVMKAYAKKKQMRLQMQAMNKIAFRSGAISEADYKRVAEQLEGQTRE